MTASQAARPAMARVLSLRGFRLLFIGEATSLLGDQFALVAMPWLALQLTGDPLTLGIVLALEGVPRAAFMLLGGAVTDRLSPRGIMLTSDIVRVGLTAVLAVVVLTGAAHTWMLYVFGLGFGLVAGFAVPAGNSIVPTLVAEEDLQAGNAVVMGVGQLVGFVGPTVAGILIGGYAHSYLGIGLAFGIDAASFAVSALCLALIGSASRRLADVSDTSGGVWRSIVAGLRHLWADETLRLVYLLLMAVNFLLIGPILVGIPVLADQRLPQGALAFGFARIAGRRGRREQVEPHAALRRSRRAGADRHAVGVATPRVQSVQREPERGRHMTPQPARAPAGAAERRSRSTRRLPCGGRPAAGE
ncbi:MAG: MFS transporter [Gemmatimonadota bacterium]